MAVKDVGTLTRAAEKLHLTQSALSPSMKRLERELDVELFVRTKNTIYLSETGERAAALKSIVQDSSFPSFTTDIAISAGNISDRQTAIKITDENGVMPFYLVGLERRKSEIQDLLPFLRSKT